MPNIAAEIEAGLEALGGKGGGPSRKGDANDLTLPGLP